MSTRRCDGCGRRVHVAGGIGDFWDFGTRETPDPGGLVLELADDTEHFLCMQCIDDLPDNPTEADVQALGDRDADSASGQNTEDAEE